MSAPAARLMNAANWVTVGRIALVPVFVVLAYLDSDFGSTAALVVFLIASISDRLDGELARKHGLVSRFGEFLDPLADKLLVGAALFVLVDLRLFPLWAALVIAIREVAVQILRTRIVGAGGTLPASSMGKIKTVLQVSMVTWWLFDWSERNVGHWAFMAAALAVTAWSGIQYFLALRTVAARPS